MCNLIDGTAAPETQPAADIKGTNFDTGGLNHGVVSGLHLAGPYPPRAGTQLRHCRKTGA